jgi:hypothetical protein
MSQKDLYDILYNKLLGENKTIWVMLTIATVFGMFLVTNWERGHLIPRSTHVGNGMLCYILLSVLFGSLAFILSRIKIDRVNDFFILNHCDSDSFLSEFGKNNIVSLKSKKFNIAIHLMILICGSIQFVTLVMSILLFFGFTDHRFVWNILNVHILQQGIS